MKHIREWNELLTLPVALVLWYIMPLFFRMIDETAGAYDIGILQVLVLATIALYFGKTIVWLSLKIGAPEVYKKLDGFLGRNDNDITTWQKGLFSLVYYCCLLLAWVLLIMAFV